MKVLLASPRGFCAGVVRAIETVKLNIEKHGTPLYVLHEIVHNKHVIEELEKRGAIFVENLSDIPHGKICIFSAHGVSTAVEREADRLGLRTINATCPLVSSVHNVVERYHKQDFDILIIGHHNHPEVEGTAGRVDSNVHIIESEQEAENIQVRDSNKVVYVTQTTLSQDDISGIKEVFFRRFPNIKGQSSNICFATQNRQNAVNILAKKCDIIFVVGSKNSSNSNRLREVANRSNCDAYLIDDFRDIDKNWLTEKKVVGITAGASAPERLVQGVLEWLSTSYDITIESMSGKTERVSFKPAELLKSV